MILFIHEHGNASGIRKLNKENKYCNYIFLGDDQGQLVKWEDAFGSKSMRIPTGKPLKQIVDRFRRPFLDLISRLNRKHQSEDWWMSRISEQNTLISSLFIDCCKLELTRRLIIEARDNKSEHIVIIINNLALLKSLIPILKEHHIEYRVLDKYLFMIDGLKNNLVFLYRLLKFAKVSIIKIIAARLLLKNKNKTCYVPGRKQVLLHNYLNEASFNESNQYYDRYFGRLSQWLEKKGYYLHIIPSIFEFDKSIYSVYKQLRSSEINFIIAEDFYGLRDYFRSIKTSFKLLFLPSGDINFETLNLSHLIKKERLIFASASMDLFMYRDLPSRLKEAGLKFDLLIDVFEGMIPEKALLLGMKKAFPEAVCIGYQHSFINRNELSHFTYDPKTADSILPDKIVCTGPFTKNILIKEGLPENKVVAGCALRYEYLWQSKGQPYLLKKGETEDNVLVALPLVVNVCADIISKTALAVNELKNTKFFFKPHPMLSPAVIVKLIDNCGLDGNYEIVQGSMDEYLCKATVMVTSGSTAALESLALGVPVVIIGSETLLDFNPLDWFETAYAKMYFEPEEIKQRISELQLMTDIEKKELRQYGKYLLKQCFTPVSDKGMEVFVHNEAKYGNGFSLD